MYETLAIKLSKTKMIRLSALVLLLLEYILSGEYVAKGPVPENVLNNDSRATMSSANSDASIMSRQVCNRH